MQPTLQYWLALQEDRRREANPRAGVISPVTDTDAGANFDDIESRIGVVAGLVPATTIFRLGM